MHVHADESEKTKAKTEQNKIRTLLIVITVITIGLNCHICTVANTGKVANK